MRLETVLPLKLTSNVAPMESVVVLGALETVKAVMNIWISLPSSSCQFGGRLKSTDIESYGPFKVVSGVSSEVKLTVWVGVPAATSMAGGGTVAAATPVAVGVKLNCAMPCAEEFETIPARARLTIMMNKAKRKIFVFIFFPRSMALLLLSLTKLGFR